MTGYTDLTRLYDDPIDPAALDFTTKPGTACKGCLFQRQRIAVCNQVEQIARREGLARCDLTPVIYVARDIDPRQLNIESEAA